MNQRLVRSATGDSYYIAVKGTDGKDKLVIIDNKLLALDKNLLKPTGPDQNAGGVGRFSTWNEFNTAMAQTDNHGKLFFIQNINNREQLGNNAAVGYIIDGNNYKLFPDWIAAKKYIDEQITLMQGTIQTQIQALENIDDINAAKAFTAGTQPATGGLPGDTGGASK